MQARRINQGGMAGKDVNLAEMGGTLLRGDQVVGARALSEVLCKCPSLALGL